ncbi:MAG: PHP domain-containing protein [Lentisphaeria bacterium]|nr:PHP domain-containing protein [Lentisphaeria bacterium]MBO5991552.1 PHP domain-containing protein [Lentisphaeria bacterium]MBO7153945.1 PHP domain-containing protein [Lentisphaeria bacterium]
MPQPEEPIYGHIDLHTHSFYSDGSGSPRELLEEAKRKGLSAVALTDHDTVAGIPDLLDAAKDFPELEAIPGVELSSVYAARELHIVGLWIDHTSEELISYLEEQRVKRCSRNETMRKKLASLGFPFDWDEPEFAQVEFSNIGRPHIANVMCRKYGFDTPQTVFEKLIGHNRPAYVRRDLPYPAQAITAIRSAGGVAVWAHPTYREKNERNFVKKMAKRLAASGLGGIEAYYTLFGPNETRMVTEIAELTGLAKSGGSDWHGKNSPETEVGTGKGGLRVPDSLLEELRRFRNV